MKYIPVALAAFFCNLSITAGATVDVEFSPGNAESSVVKFIRNARQSVHMAAYSFTSRSIETALIEAHEPLYADTQGQLGPVFAISYLLGIKLMPRIRNWKHLSFLRPCESATYKYIDPLFKDVVNWSLILMLLMRAFFMVHLSHNLLADFRQLNPSSSIIDLKAYYCGFRYVHEILKMLPEMPEPILLSQIFAKLTSLGRIHPGSTSIEPS